MKFDVAGNVQWYQTLGGSGAEHATSIQQTVDGGFIVAGTSSSNDSDVSANYGLFDCWIVKLDSAGTIQWEQNYGGSSYENFVNVIQTSDDGYLMWCQTNSMDSDLVSNPYSSASWIVKLSNTGSIQWQKTFGGCEYANSVIQTNDGGYMIVGDNCDLPDWHGSMDYWAAKLNNVGDLIWQKSYGGTYGETAFSVKQTSNSGYVISGWSVSDDGDVTFNQGNADSWTIYIDSVGNILWQHSYGGTGSDIIYSIETTADNGYILAGITTSFDGDVIGNHGASQEAWILKLDSLGALVWNNCYGGTSSESAYSIQQTFDDGYIVAGGSYSIDGDVVGNHGSSDFWVFKLDGSTGILNPFHSETILVYPNPSYGNFNIEIEDRNGMTNGQNTIEIVDIYGKSIIKRAILESKLTIELNEKTPSGIYILNFIDNRGLVIAKQKLIVQ
ncbi:MAG: T9SS type A sorting domain-containing protein [Bacteroidetes bacterium]|nr:T9SS type A sorting domain-containing protein [Bacteroidota bacterium]